MKRLNLVGKTFGKLKVLGRCPTSSPGKIKWVCQCACGQTISVLAGHLPNGHTRSCGCLRVRHGAAAHTAPLGLRRAHASYRAMRKRCLDPRHQAYNKYGQRGISICPRWQHSFTDFYTDMGDPPSEHHSLDRIDNAGNYEPSNCRWATMSEQSCNRSSTRLVTIGGVTQSCAEWARHAHLNLSTFIQRLNSGGSGASLLREPFAKKLPSL